MRQPTSKPTNPFAEIDRMLGLEAEPTGPEWFEIKQYMAYSGLSSKSAVARRLDALVKAGKMEHWVGTAAATKRITSKYRLKAANPPRSNKRQ